MPDTPHTVRPEPQRDEAVGYRPISALAVAAVGVAVLCLVTVVGIWLMARARGRPILVPSMLVASAVGLVLAVAAQWQLARSEGTRSGRGLARIAFWVSLFALGGYGAYFFATDLAVRQQARGVGDQFFELLNTGKPELAFRLTRPPAQQRGMELDAEKIRARFGSTDYFVFDTSDLTRTFRTWGPDRVRYEFTGERDRQDQPDGFQVELNYAIKTPEGVAEFAMSTKGTDDPATGGRDWQILYPRSGFRQDRRFTKLGRMCQELQYECVRRFLPVQWAGEMEKKSADEMAAIVHKEGSALPNESKEAVIADVRQPRAINLFPGGGPLRGNALPTMRFTGDGVWLTQVVEVTAPSVDKAEPKVPAVITMKIVKDQLVKDLLKLAGPGWEKQPLLAVDPDAQPELEPYGLDNVFQVTELNLRPTLPRIVSGPQALGGP